MPFIMVCFPYVLFPLLICLPLGRVCVKNTLAASPALLLSDVESYCVLSELGSTSHESEWSSIISPPVGHAAAVLLFTFSEQLSGTALYD